MKFLKKRKIKVLEKKLSHYFDIFERTPGEQSLKALLKGYEKLAQFCQKLRTNPHFPWAADWVLENYRSMASLNDPKAQLWCAQHLIEKAQLNETWLKTPVYASSRLKERVKALYGEGLAYLNQASNQEYALARRFLGNVYLKGWGVPRDVDVGYKLILESIDLANAWDRATQIFEELGINSPAFFNSLRAYMGKADT